AYLDRVNLSIAGKSIAKEFGLGNVQLGWIFSAFLLGYAFFQAPAGRLADRLGPRLVLMLGVIWWAVFTVLITILPAGMSGLLFVFIGIRFCLGIGEAVMYPASNCVVSAWIPSAERGIANGLIFAGVGFGAGVTSPLIASVMIHYGWRAAFILSAAIGLVAGTIWFVLARNSPRQHPWVTSEEVEDIEAGLPRESTNAAVPTMPWSAILRNTDIWAITFSYFCYGYAAQIFFNWFFIYLSEVRGLNLRQSSYFTMLPFIAMSIGSLVGGAISDRLTTRYGKRIGRCGIAFVGIALAAVFIALGTQVESAQLASVVLAGGAGALYLSQSSFWSISADIGGKSAGTVSGVMNMGGQIGGALTASLTPAIAARFGWSASFLVAAGLCACGALVWIAVRESVKMPQLESTLSPAE
ncbi:MAG: MFS transporter, partial [Acidobacteriota bacterium]|nr:MFS transporter [Acidobacteriota bacterium]